MDIRSNAIDHYFEDITPRAKTPELTMLVFKIMLTLNLWLDTARSRKQLSQLGDAELRDIGVSRADADAESQRKFYDI